MASSGLPSRDDDSALADLLSVAPLPPTIDAARSRGGGREGRVESLQAEAEAHATRGDALADAVERADAEIGELTAELRSLAAERGAASQSDAADAASGLQRRAERLLGSRTAELDRARARGDALAAQLAAQRRDIDAHRMTRMTQQRVLSRMRGDVARLAAETAALDAATDAAMSERDAAVSQLAQLREGEHAAVTSHAALASSLTDAIRAGHAAAAAATVDATDDDGADSAAAGEDGGEPGSGNLTEEQEAAARATIVQFDEFIVELEAILQDLHRQTGQLQDVFAGLLRSGRMERLEDLVARFGADEAFRDETFAYVQHCANEVVELEARTRVLDAERSSMRARATVDAAAARAAAATSSARERRLWAAAAAADAARRALHDAATDGLAALLAAYVAAGGDEPRLVEFWRLSRPTTTTAAVAAAVGGGDDVSSRRESDNAPLADTFAGAAGGATDHALPSPSRTTERQQSERQQSERPRRRASVLRQLLLELPDGNGEGGARGDGGAPSTSAWDTESDVTAASGWSQARGCWSGGGGFAPPHAIRPLAGVAAAAWRLIGDTEQRVTELCGAASDVSVRD